MHPFLNDKKTVLDVQSPRNEKRKQFGGHNSKPPFFVLPPENLKRQSKKKRVPFRRYMKMWREGFFGGKKEEKKLLKMNVHRADASLLFVIVRGEGCGKRKKNPKCFVLSHLKKNPPPSTPY